MEQEEPLIVFIRLQAKLEDIGGWIARASEAQGAADGAHMSKWRNMWKPNNISTLLFQSLNISSSFIFCLCCLPRNPLFELLIRFPPLQPLLFERLWFFFSYKLSQIVASTALKSHLFPVVDYVAQIRHWHGGGHKHGYETRQVLENGETDVAKNFKIVFSAMAYANLHSNYWMFWLWLLPNALLANGICLKTFEVINVLSPKSYQNFWKSLYRVPICVPEVSDMDTTSVSAS